MRVPDIALIGKARSGKDTIAAYLSEKYGHERVAFADELKKTALDIDPMVLSREGDGVLLSTVVDVYGWEAAKDFFPEVRRFLINLGNTARERFSEDIWLSIGLQKAAKLTAEDVPVVFTDVRYGNEYHELRQRGYTTLRVVRPSADQINHVSETGLDAFWTDATIVNDGSLERLYDKIDNLLNQPR